MIPYCSVSYETLLKVQDKKYNWNQIGQTALTNSKNTKQIQSTQHIKDYKNKFKEGKIN